MIWQGLQVAQRTAQRIEYDSFWAFAGVAAALLSVLLHGLVDSFMTFTPTYVIISVTAGLLLACNSLATPLTPGRRDMRPPPDSQRPAS